MKTSTGSRELSPPPSVSITSRVTICSLDSAAWLETVKDRKLSICEHYTESGCAKVKKPVDSVRNATTLTKRRRVDGPDAAGANDSDDTCTRLIPRVAATMSTVTPSLIDTSAVTIASHAFVPPHTPQLSVVPVSQHTPEGGSGEWQHLPVRSTATALPPQIPHASTTPTQHRPALSTLALLQHMPVTASTAVVQQCMVESSTPLGHGTAPLISSNELQSKPAQPLRHTHTPSSHAMWGLKQSGSTMHWHDSSAAMQLRVAGRTVTFPVVEPTHSDLSTLRPLSSTHATSRLWAPNTSPQLGVPGSGTHSPHADGCHVNKLSGHGNRLHGMALSGLGKPCARHTKSVVAEATPLASVRVHTGDEAAVTPRLGAPLRVVADTHGTVHGDQSSNTAQYKPGHAPALHDSLPCGLDGSSAWHRSSLACRSPKDDKHATVRCRVPPRPHDLEHADHDVTYQENTSTNAGDDVGDGVGADVGVAVTDAVRVRDMLCGDMVFVRDGDVDWVPVTE